LRIANLSGRAVLLGHTMALDIATASHGKFGPEPRSVWAQWTDFSAWADGIDVDSNDGSVYFDEAHLGAPSPLPSQIFAVGLNYADHAAESDMVLPENPIVFTKFPSSLTGPHATVRLSGDRVDWEAELVVVIGTGGRGIPESAGWSAVAGLTVGQDISDRTVQSWGAPSAQFVLSYIADGDGELRLLQEGNTRNMIFSVPVLVSRLSAIVELRPGDLIFTGTPKGVGLGRKPPVFLKDGQRLTTTIEGVGTIRQVLRA